MRFAFLPSDLQQAIQEPQCSRTCSVMCLTVTISYLTRISQRLQLMAPGTETQENVDPGDLALSYLEVNTFT